MNNWVLSSGLSAAGVACLVFSVGLVSDFAGVDGVFCFEGVGVLDDGCFKADLSGTGGVDSSSSSSSSSSYV
jgi:hypothetical protein